MMRVCPALSLEKGCCLLLLITEYVDTLTACTQVYGLSIVPDVYAIVVLACRFIFPEILGTTIMEHHI